MITIKILYVTPSFTGAEKIILNESNEYSGLPPFVKMIQGLRQRGHDIDFIIVDKKEKSKLYLNNKNNVTFSEWEVKGIGRLFSVIRLIGKIKGKIKENKYDFIYGHGSIGAISTIMARINNVPTGQRLYGAYPLLNKFKQNESKIKIFLKQPLYYLSFKLKKEFLIVTNDGTQGDLINEKINQKQKQNFNFYFWTNGVDLLSYKKPLIDTQENFILYPGRIDSQKQQINALNVIEKLKNNECNIKFYFAGDSTFAYAKKVKEAVIQKGLEEQVVFLGAVSREGMGYLYEKALATLLLYDISNKGNTSLEALKAGSIIITYNNSGLNELIENNISGFLINDEKDAAKVISSLVFNEIDVKSIKNKAKEIANLYLESWDERIKKEINLLEKSIK